MSLYDQSVVKVSLAPAEVTDGTANGTAVDRGVNGGMQDAMLVVTTGVVTDGSHAVAIQDSANGSTGWAAVDASQLTGAAPTVDNADDGAVFEVGIRSTRRYLRAVVVTTGSTTGAFIGAHIVLSSPRNAPVTRA
ncbi:hypothetical protein [Streptomyces sp. RK76]|uniref:hypothetical protein n=1 Tax=Streptomyces sp. RK76 TaxID=2824896 RepID=UPI001B372804|nr:hypothetical protein [Streptomyces sp. RK76]MBQ0947655.1 hypothetical protein [Streptomyces sp. RK76]